MHPVIPGGTHRASARPWLYAAVLLLAVAHPAQAKTDFDDLARVSNQELDQLRGGFYVNGMNIGFSLDTATLVNGVLQSQSSINGIAGSNLVQLGNGNTLSLSAFQNAQGVLNVIQNSLDSQVIQHLTTLNIDISKAGIAANQLNLNSLLNQQALTGMP